MSILSRLWTARRSVSAATTAKGGGAVITTSDELAAAIRTALAGSSSGTTVTTKTAMGVPAVYACVRLISGAVANLPIHVKRRIDSNTRADEVGHPVWSLMRRRPNRWQTPSQFRRTMTSHVLLRGNAFALIVRSRGRVIDLVPLDPDRMEVQQLDDHQLVFKYRRQSGGHVTLGQDEVMHLCGLSLDGITGLSVIAYARESLGLAIAQEKHGATTFANAARPSSVLVHPNKLGKEGIENIRESLSRYRSGGESEGQTLVLEEGMALQPVSMTSQDAQWIEGRAFSRTDVAMFFGVPPHMIGDTEKGTSWGTGIEQQQIGFSTYTLEDYLTTWEEAINRDLITQPDIYARFNRAALVRADIKTRKEFYTAMVQWGVFSPNEIRGLEDMNPREGGDAFYDPPNTAGTPAPTGSNAQ